jgi:uncharacterized protein YndB with AHSA1/START domain
MTQTEPTRSVVIDREMPYPPQKIWRALTEGPLIEEWLMANDFKPAVGHRFSFRSTPVAGWDGIIHSHVEIVEPPSLLVYTWDTMGMETLVTWTLAPTPTGTRVRMEHSGFGPGPGQDHAYKGATYGWKNFIGKLELVAGGLN